jgi:signal transduction histidine kinase
MVPTPAPIVPRRGIRVEDVAWLTLIAALGLTGPQTNNAELQLLGLLAVFQVVEPRVAWFQTARGAIAGILLKLLLAYLLIGVTGGVTSSYYLILMVPVVAAATTLGALGTFAVAIVAGGSYLSFLAFVDWERYSIPPSEARELGLRVLLFGLLALLMHQLAAASRRQALQYAATAQELAEANRHLREAEAAVRRSERLAALGQLTAGLAHELRNPLGTMKASAEVLLKQWDTQPEVARELAGYIRDEVDRTDSLITRFLDFARPLEPKLAPADVNAVLDHALAQIQRRIPPPPVSFVRNYSPDVGTTMMDAELMERVFGNLLANAVDASSPGATITLKTRPALRGIEVAVIDRGMGIEKSQMESIFNPFFTTKPNGVGLGLAIVSKIVDGHRGKLEVESEPRQGSVFRVWLPAGNAE